jgi:hypothetical protein
MDVFKIVGRLDPEGLPQWALLKQQPTMLIVDEFYYKPYDGRGE